MSNIKDLSKFRRQIFRHALNALYTDIGAFKLENETTLNRKLTEDEIKSRALLFRKIRGQFLKIFREKSNKSETDIAAHVGWTVDEYKIFEDGEVACPDAIFFKLCAFLEANSEVSVLLEKVEEAFTPGLSDARKEQAESLKRLGIVFADKDKYDSEKKGKILQFLRNLPKKPN